MSRKRSLRERFSVFEFNEEDESVEKASETLVGKFGNPSKSKKRDLLHSPVTKYNFLRCFAGHTGPVEKQNRNEPIDVDDEPIDLETAVSEDAKAQCKENSNPLVDVDANVISHHRQYSVSNPMRMPQEDCAVQDDISQLDTCVLSSSSNYMDKPFDVISDVDDDDWNEVSSSSTSASSAENGVPLEEQVLEHSVVGHKIDCLNMTVIVFPDFILYGDIYCTESHLTFSSSCIRVEGSTINGAKGTFNTEWTIDDIINIESEWCGRVETAMINLHLKSKSKGAGNANEASGIDKLKFSVYDPFWSEGQEAIKSLDVRYRDIWNVAFDTDREDDQKASFGHNGRVISRPYFSVLGETFEGVIYPKGDPDAVSISKRDVELLQPETFINDTIIDFYIQYLKNKIEPVDQHRFHFFNSFFFRKLADLDKDPSSAFEGRAAFQRVRKWTRKVNLFEKDYIFIPVNYSLHWSLIVICHPGEVTHFRDDESQNSLKVPCILHMDSIRGSHRGLKNLVQSYLCEEWKERHSESTDEVSSRFLHLRFVPLELPQQENSFDCGLFLLHYVELFLEEAPSNFSPFKITKFSNFLNRNWFPPEEASLKRAHIQKLICEILKDQFQKVPSGQSIGQYRSSQFPDTNEQETGIVFLEERLSSPKTCQGHSSAPNTELEIGILVSAASPPRVGQQQIRELGLNSRELFELRTSARPFANGNYWQIGTHQWSRFLPRVEEIAGTNEQISDSSSDTDDCWQTAELATESNTTSYMGRNFRSLGTSLECGPLEEFCDDDSSSGTSTSGSQKSSEIGIDEDCMHPELQGFHHPKESNEQESSSTSSEDLADCVVEDSQEENCMHDGNVVKDSPSFHCQVNELAPSIEELTSVKAIVKENDVPTSNEDLVAESDEQAAKRPRFMFTERGER